MENNERYNYYKRLHPEWSEEQIWTAVSIDMQTANTIKKGGEDVNVNDENVIRSILKSAQQWLEEVLPAIYRKVADFFRKAFEWIKQGIHDILDWILGRIDDDPFC